MARACLVCVHPEHEKIDADIILKRKTIAVIAQEYGVSKDSINRHVANGHIAKQVSKAVTAISESKAIMSKGELIGRIHKLIDDSNGILDACRKDGDKKNALGAIRELRATAELLMRITGELKTESPNITVGVVVNTADEVKRCLKVIEDERRTADCTVS